MFPGYDHVVSLGWICNIGTLLHVKMKQPFGAFDGIATPMWAVTELVENSFDSFLTNMSTAKIYQNSDKIFSYDTKHFVRTLAKNVDTDGFSSFRLRMQEKGKLFMKMILKENSTILFIRAEEPSVDRLYGIRSPPDEFKEKYAHDELFYLRKFSDALKILNPSLKFKILYLGSAGQFHEEERNIVGIPGPTEDYRHPLVIKNMIKTVEDNRDYFSKFI